MSKNLLSRILIHLEEEEERPCIILHGGIGAGKTHTAAKLAANLKERSVFVGGILSPRISQGDETIGYTVLDLASGEQRRFASLKPPGIQVGRFFIAAEGLTFACDAIEKAAGVAQVVFVDEVGRLELVNDGLASAVHTLLCSKALPVLLVRTSFVNAVVGTFPIVLFTEVAVGE